MMYRLWFGILLFSVALTVALAEVMSRRVEADRTKRHDEMTRVQREADETAAVAWDNN